MDDIIKNKTVLITGGTGSFGKRFIKRILENYDPKKVIIYSRDELKQFEMQQIWPDGGKMRYFIGDIRDYSRLKMAMQDVDIVVHAAAIKQVPAAEYNPFEAVKTNIIGSQNVIDAALRTNVERIIALSTDKAAAPVNLYGATKLASDKLFVAANNYKGKNNIKISVVRYGNVMGSRGSVIPFFKKLNLDKRQLPITDERMTRFSITLDEGVQFVIDCIGRMWGGEVFIPKIPSYNIVDVAKAVSPPNGNYKIVGSRPGEKLHEEMITETDSPNTIEFNSYYVILPSVKLWDIEKFINQSDSIPGKYCLEGFVYHSGKNNKFLTVEEIQCLMEDSL